MNKADGMTQGLLADEDQLLIGREHQSSDLANSNSADQGKNLNNGSEDIVDGKVVEAEERHRKLSALDSIYS